MALIDEHLLAMPFGLPGGRDERLFGYLAEEDWGSALVVLRDAVTPETVNVKWLVLLAYVRFRDAVEVMVDELGPACREALGLLDRALAAGAALDAVGPLREAVETALDQVSREELRLSGLVEAGRWAELSPEDLEGAAVLYWATDPRKASELFGELGERVSGARALIAKAHGAVAAAEAGVDGVEARLETLAAADWTVDGLRGAGSVLESVETALLMRQEGQAFELTWQLAEQRGRALEYPFPSVWPNQEKLLRRCVELKQWARAKAVAQVIEDGREEMSLELMGLVGRSNSTMS